MASTPNRKALSRGKPSPSLRPRIGPVSALLRLFSYIYYVRKSSFQSISMEATFLPSYAQVRKR